ncbi:unnamed protein product [Choristocarpus tenellus]
MLVNRDSKCHRHNERYSLSSLVKKTPTLTHRVPLIYFYSGERAGRAEDQQGAQLCPVNPSTDWDYGVLPAIKGAGRQSRHSQKAFAREGKSEVEFHFRGGDSTMGRRISKTQKQKANRARKSRLKHHGKAITGEKEAVEPGDDTMLEETEVDHRVVVGRYIGGGGGGVGGTTETSDQEGVANETLQPLPSHLGKKQS